MAREEGELPYSFFPSPTLIGEGAGGEVLSQTRIWHKPLLPRMRLLLQRPAMRLCMLDKWLTQVFGEIIILVQIVRCVQIQRRAFRTVNVDRCAGFRGVLLVHGEAVCPKRIWDRARRTNQQ